MVTDQPFKKSNVTRHPSAATVDRFFAALSAGDLDRAGAELDPDLIILESGSAGRKSLHIHGSSHVKKPGEAH